MEPRVCSLRALMEPRTKGRLPTDAVILSFLAPATPGNAHKVHQDLIVTQTIGDIPELRILVANHHRLRMVQNIIDVANHELRDVGNAVENKVPVGAHQAGDVYI